MKCSESILSKILFQYIVNPKSDLPYCLLIQKYTQNILDYTKGMTEKDFCTSSITYDACILNFINIGEQVKSLSNEFKDRYDHIPYKKIIGLRNIAAHSYEGLEAFRLFAVIKEDIPVFLDQFSRIINSGELQ